MDYPPQPRRSGALAHKNVDGVWQVTCPDEALYSTATMVATHFYADGQWKPILEDDDDSQKD